MPTTRIHGVFGAAPLNRRRRPTGSDTPGQNVLTNVSLTIIAPPPALSLSSKNRPLFSRMPIALKYPGEAGRKSVTGFASPDAAGLRPSVSKNEPQWQPSGGQLTSPEASIPGNAASFS